MILMHIHPFVAHHICITFTINSLWNMSDLISESVRSIWGRPFVVHNSQVISLKHNKLFSSKLSTPSWTLKRCSETVLNKNAMRYRLLIDCEWDFILNTQTYSCWKISYLCIARQILMENYLRDNLTLQIQERLWNDGYRRCEIECILAMWVPSLWSKTSPWYLSWTKSCITNLIQHCAFLQD